MQSDIEQCSEMLRSGSRTFHAASLVFPRRYREPAFAVYAFCRVADDAIDVSDDPTAALDDLRARLDSIFRRRPIANPADRSFAAVIEHFAIPRALPEALLEGFQWDAENRCYETLDDLIDYAVRVAGTVGGMMTLLMERRDPAIVARAIDLGVAMQLTNIARDVGEDARAGRLYLPLSWLRETGIDPDRFMADPTFDGNLGAVIRRLLEAAEIFYLRAEKGIAFLPAGCRPAIAAARVLYAEIGREVERNKFDSVSRRAVVSSRRKVLRAAGIGHVALALAPARGPGVEPLPQAMFLIDAIVSHSRPRTGTEQRNTSVPWWNFTERAIGLIELLERVERRQRLKRANS